MNEPTPLVSATGPAILPATVPVCDVSPEDLASRLVVGFDGTDSRSRPFNLLRSQLNRLIRSRDWRIIGMTSATPSAGKTFCSVNLAAAWSRISDAPVILCDLDLRRGTVARALGIEPERSLDQYLRGEIDDWQDVLVRIGETNLLVLPSHRPYADSSALLASERFTSLMADLRALSKEHFVLCDLPPVFANDDAMLSVRELDSYLFVVDHGLTTARQLEDGLAMLSPTPCVGTIINRYNGGLGDDYGYGYGDYYNLKDY